MSVLSVFNPKIGVGINAGNCRFSCARISKKVRQYVVEEISDKHWDDNQAYGINPQLFCHHLGLLVQQIKAENNGKYYAINIALPDPVVLYHIVNLQQLPKPRQAIKELVRWNVAKHYHLPANDYAATCTYLGKQDKQHIFLGGIIEQNLIHKIQKTLSNTGVLASQVDANIRFVFNYVYEKLEDKTGAMIYLHSDYWSLCIWDEKKNIRHIHSQWRSRHDNEGDDISDIIAGSKRTLFSYLSGQSTNKIEALYVFANAMEEKRLNDELGLEFQTLSDKCNTNIVSNAADMKTFSAIYQAVAIPQ